MEEHTKEAAQTTATTEIESRIAEEKRSSRKTITAFVLGMVVSIGGYMLYDRFSVDAVATVNGTKISAEQLDKDISMMTETAKMQGIDVTDAAVIGEIQNQALTNLINNELLMGAARRAGVGTNEAAVQSAYQNLIDEVGGEDVLKTRMDEVGLTSETLMSNINDRLTVDAYLEAETDIENVAVSDEDVTAYLASLTADGVTLPPREEIEDQIRASLVAEKQQALIDAHIEKLRSEAKITIDEPEAK